MPLSIAQLFFAFQTAIAPLGDHVIFDNYFILILLGFCSGLLAGVLGLGGGVVLVPMIKALGYSPVQAVATSSLAIILTSASGSWQNWRMGNLDLKKVLFLAFPAIFTAQIGAWAAHHVDPSILLLSLSIFLVLNIFLSQFRQKIINSFTDGNGSSSAPSPLLARLITGLLTGLLAGFFGIGGGIILVPLQIILLGEEIKSAIQISLGVIVITSISACAQHYHQGNILLFEGLFLGLGGLVGAQISTRFLPKISSHIVNYGFNFILGILAVYIGYQAYLGYSIQ